MKLIKALVEVGKVNFNGEIVRLEDIGSEAQVSDEMAEYLGGQVEVLEDVKEQKETKKSSRKK